MSITGKHIAIGSSLVAVLGLGVWAMRKKSFGDNIVIVNDIKVEVAKNGFGIPKQFTLKVTPTIKNPTTVKATITQPFVALRFLKTDVDAFATSQASNITHHIEPLSETPLNTIEIKVAISDIATKAFDVATNIIKTKKLSLFAKTTCYLVTTAGKLKVEQEDESTIKF